jgi:hypothetical protein
LVAGVGRRFVKGELPELLSSVSAELMDKFEDGELEAEMFGDLLGSCPAFSTCLS